MAKGRIISRSISTSRKVSVVSDQAALLLSWLIPHTDDYGRIEGGADDILFAVVPRRRWEEAQVEKFLKELWLVNLIRTYHEDDKRYIEIVDFENHQTFRSDRSRVAKCPTPKKDGYDITWYTNDNQRGKEDAEVKLSQVKDKSSKVKPRKDITQGKPASSKEVKKDDEVPNPDVKSLIDFFYKAANAIQGVKPVINGGKVGSLLKKRLAGGITTDRIEKMTIWYLSQKSKYQDEKKDWHSKFKYSPDMGVMLSDAFFNQLLSDEVNALTYMRDNMANLEKIYSRIGAPTENLKVNVQSLIEQLTVKMGVKTTPKYE